MFCLSVTFSPLKIMLKYTHSFFKQCMEWTLHNLEGDDANEIDDDPFELYK